MLWACACITLNSYSWAKENLTHEQGETLIRELLKEGQERQKTIDSLRADITKGYVVYLGAGEYDIKRNDQLIPDVPGEAEDRLLKQVDALNRRRMDVLKKITDTTGIDSKTLAKTLVIVENEKLPGVGSDKPGILPEYVIARVGAVWFKDMELSTKQKPALDPFSILTVLSRSEDKIHVQGRGVDAWIENKDVIPWKQYLCLQFPNPKGDSRGERSRVLFFDSLDRIKGVADLPSADEINSKVSQMYDLLEKPEQRQSLDSYGVISSESEQWSNRAFYPILNHSKGIYIGTNGHALEIAAMTKPQQTKGLTVEGKRDLVINKGMPIDIVFVIDLTNSMQISLDAVKKCVASTADLCAKKHMDINFALWGYRDDPSIGKGFEFVSRSFTDKKLVPLKEFMRDIAQVKAASSSDPDFYEDVLKGVADASEQTEWRENSLKLMIMMGDAPGREGVDGVDPTCTAKVKPVGTAFRAADGLSAATAQSLGAELKTRNIYATGVFISYEKWKQYLAEGKRQFNELAFQEAAVVDGDTPSMERGFETIVSRAVLQIVEKKQQLVSGTVVSDKRTESNLGDKLADGIFDAAFVDWVSKNRSGQDEGVDFTGWVFSADLKKSRIAAVKPYVLMTRKQMNDLYLSLQNVLQALAQNSVNMETSGGSFYDTLMSTSLWSAKDPNQLGKRNDASMKSLIPQYLEELPFKSSLMNATRESLDNPKIQRALKIRVQGIVQFIRQVYADDSVWRKLSERDDSEEFFLYPLDQLP